jgi:hypothetical protein
MNHSEPEDRTEGDYRFMELLGEDDLSRTWLAEQVSVSRTVLVVELRPERMARRGDFLADVRAKAAVDHPLIGPVYEAVAGETRCFYVCEKLHGATLQDHLEAGESLEPLRLAELLRKVSEAQLHHESAGHATLPLEPGHIHLDGHAVVRLRNLAVSGSRDAFRSLDDIIRLGRALPPLVAEARPGATRMLTLFSWMRGEGLEAPLDWQQIGGTCAQIEQQLDSPLPASTVHLTTARNPHGARRRLLALAATAALAALAALAMLMRQRAADDSSPAALPQVITIPAGSHPAPDGGECVLPAFRISTHEVTIAGYAEFLDTLEALAANGLERTFDHKEQPAEKTSHVPDDWDAMFKAARTRGRWNDQRVTLQHPVAGIDWWDAAAYAEWKKARLPSQEEWFAALRHGGAPAEEIPTGGWEPVTARMTDRTASGLLGMAGSVCEWTSVPATNPNNPLGGRHWVLAGGSYLKPGSTAVTREWTADRSLRRADLGFRLVFDAE